jgi:hypothetical protein
MLWTKKILFTLIVNYLILVAIRTWNQLRKIICFISQLVQLMSLLITAISSFWLSFRCRCCYWIWNELIFSNKVLNYFKISFLMKYYVLYSLLEVYYFSYSMFYYFLIQKIIQDSLKWNFMILKEVKTYSLVQINCAGVNSFVGLTWRGDGKTTNAIFVRALASDDLVAPNVDDDDRQKRRTSANIKSEEDELHKSSHVLTTEKAFRSREQ